MSGAAVRRMNAIAEQGLCIGCGICQAIAGKDRIEVAKNQDGNLRPIVRGDLDDDLVDRVYDICPGTTVRGLPERLVDGIPEPTRSGGRGGGWFTPGQVTPCSGTRDRRAGC